LSLLAHGGAVAAVGVLGVAWLGGSPPAPAPAPLYVDLVQPLVATNDGGASGEAPLSRRPARASPTAPPGPVTETPRPDSGVSTPAVAADPRVSVSETAPRPFAGPVPAPPEIAPPPTPPPPAPVAPEPRRAPTELAATPGTPGVLAGPVPAPSPPPAAPASVPAPAMAEPTPPDPSSGASTGAFAPSAEPRALDAAAPARPSTAPLPPADSHRGPPALVPADGAADRASPSLSHASPAGGGAPRGAGGADPGSLARVTPGEARAPGPGPTSPASGGAGDLEVSIGSGAIPPEYEPYLRLLRQRVQDRLVYPWMAVRRGQHGVVELEVRLGPEGRLVGVEVLAGASAESLRAAAVTAVRGAAPFPFPPGLAGRALIIRLPVEFRLR
jgi:TonB family protein